MEILAMLTKQDIVNDLLSANFELDGHSDYRRVEQFIRDEYNKKPSNKAVWAVINCIKDQDVEELDFD
jgi:hypothetical protein